MANLEMIYILLGICSLVSSIAAQQLPFIACPEYFRYLSFNGQYIGLISIRHDLNANVNDLVVDFSQRGAYQWSYVGTLSLWDDQEQTKANIRNGDPINYRVDFPNPQIPPKLTLIKLNGVPVCSSTQYNPPRTAISLVHMLRSTTAPLIFSSSPQQGPTLNDNLPIQTYQPQPQPLPQPQPQPQPVYFNYPQDTNTTAILQPIPQLGNEINNLVPKVAQTVSEVCGRERGTTTPLIFRGKPLERGQLPWLVGLFERNIEHGLTFFCGGSLISASTVISAAHCFRHPGRDLPASNTVVSLGRNTIDLISEGELRDVSQLIIHEQYKPTEYAKADLVLLRLATEVTFSDFIVPICLWSENHPLQLQSGAKAYVAGWGEDETGQSTTQQSRIVDTDIVTESNCLRELPSRLVQPNTICAKKTGAGPCGSDGGGGLMMQQNNVWLLRGVIVSGQRKENTCDLSKPSVYTDVANHIAWVRRNMWP